MTSHLYFVDWGSFSDNTNHPKVNSIQSDFHKYYKELQTSVSNLNLDELNTLLSLTDAQLSDDKNELLVQIAHMIQTVGNFERLGWEFYTRLGCSLAKLKFMYYVVCFHCQLKNRGIFEVLSCPKCAKISNSTSFFRDIRRKIKYSPGYINNLIRIAALGVKYPKVKLTPWNFGNLSKFMTFLPDQMEADRDTWI